MPLKCGFYLIIGSCVWQINSTILEPELPKCVFHDCSYCVTIHSR